MVTSVVWDADTQQQNFTRLGNYAFIIGLLYWPIPGAPASRAQPSQLEKEEMIPVTVKLSMGFFSFI